MKVSAAKSPAGRPADLPAGSPGSPRVVLDATKHE